MAAPGRVGSALTAQTALGCALTWVVALLVLNLGWEVAQLRLYSLGPYAVWPASGYAVLHCTVGDGALAFAAYAAAALVTRRPAWPMHRPVVGLAVATAAAVAFTVWSEWRNVYVIGAWAYGPDMPTIRGIGVAPLLQWLALPPVALWVLRRHASRRRRPQP